MPAWELFCQEMDAFLSKLSALRGQLRDIGLVRVKGNVFGILQKYVVDGVADPVGQDAEQLQLHAAALPEDHPLRKDLLAAANIATTFVQAGKAELTLADANGKPEFSLLIAYLKFRGPMKAVMSEKIDSLCCLLPDGSANEQAQTMEKIKSAGAAIIDGIEVALKEWGSHQDGLIDFVVSVSHTVFLVSKHFQSRI